MKLPEQYDAMREEAFRSLLKGAASLDPLLDSVEETRRGITLLTRPPSLITAGVEHILADFRRAEPEQYYYPATDIHLTILSIISCYSGFTLDQINAAEYQLAIRSILPQVRPFTITYTGLTASPGGIMLQGIPHGNSLEMLRQELRKLFRQSNLQHSIDQRYPIQTAHSTVIRFRKPLLNPERLVQLISQYQNYGLGTFEVNTVELVYNDWYQRAANTVLLEKYSLVSG